MKKTGDLIKVIIYYQDNTISEKEMSTAEAEDLVRTLDQWKQSEVDKKNGVYKIYTKGGKNERN